MKINVSAFAEYAGSLRAGDKVELSGFIYTARDAAHKRLVQLLDSNAILPFNLQGVILYYAGPTEAPFGLPIGACGPTTSSRMDKFTPRLLDLGVAATIGKGERSEAVVAAIVRNRSAYFSAIGGAGALAAECVRSVEVLAFPELGCESIKRLEVVDFPLITAIDSIGGNLFVSGRQNYLIN